MCTLIGTKDAQRLYHSCKNEPTLRTKRKMRPSDATISSATLSHCQFTTNLQKSYSKCSNSTIKTVYSGLCSSKSTRLKTGPRSQNPWVLKPSKLTAISTMTGSTFPLNDTKQGSQVFQRYGSGCSGFRMNSFGLDTSSFIGESQPPLPASMAAICMTSNGSDTTNNSTASTACNTLTPFKMAANTCTSPIRRPSNTPNYVLFKSGAKASKTDEVRFVNGFQYGNGIRLKTGEEYDSYEDSDSDISTFEIDSNISSISTLTSSNGGSSSDSSSVDSSESSDSESTASSTSSTSSSSSSSDSDMSVCRRRYRTYSHPFASNGFKKVNEYTNMQSNTSQRENAVVSFKSPTSYGKPSLNFTATACNGTPQIPTKTALSPSANSLILKKREQQWTVETRTVVKPDTTKNFTGRKEPSPAIRKAVLDEKAYDGTDGGQSTKDECTLLELNRCNSLPKRSSKANPLQSKLKIKETQNAKKIPGNSVTFKKKRKRAKSGMKYDDFVSEMRGQQSPPRKKSKIGRLPNGKEGYEEVSRTKLARQKDTLESLPPDSAALYADCSNSSTHSTDNKPYTLTAEGPSVEAKKNKNKRSKKATRQGVKKADAIAAARVKSQSEKRENKLIAKRKGKPTSMVPGRNPFKFLAMFPLVPSLVVRNGDLEPAVSMRVDANNPPAKGHPIWKWRLGGPPLPHPGTSSTVKVPGRGTKQYSKASIDAT
ncbi:serine-rich adhesin for platelets-like [Ptychodera flava]|uniref:serine-rich adhesin for platelets-like n=1 Tax=Ptychodera flava TaxID=63121 RepID=UPI00396AA897